MKARRKRLTWALAVPAAAVVAVIAALGWRLPFELWHIRKLDSSDAKEREAALQSLVALRSERGAAALFERCIAAAGDFAPGFASAEMEVSSELPRFGAAAVPALEAGLRSERASVRLWAASLLGPLREKGVSAGSALLRALEDTHETVREAAAVAFGRVARLDRGLLEQCATLVADERREVTGRKAALLALVSTGGAHLYLEALDDKVDGRARGRWNAVIEPSPAEEEEVVPEIGGDHRDLVLSSLERAAICSQATLREFALRHLVLLTVRRDEQDVPQVPASVRTLIHRGLSDADEEVRLTALLFIRAAQPLPAEALILAWQLLQRVQSDLRGMVIDALVAMAEPWPLEAWAGLAACLRDPDIEATRLEDRFVAGSDEAMDVLGGALGDASTVAREHALAIVKDLDLPVAWAARLWQPLVSTLADKHDALGDAAVAPASRLARSGAVDPRGLLDLLRADLPGVRRRAVIVLGAGRWEKDVVGPPLRAKLDDADPGVQAAALLSWAGAGGPDGASVTREASRRLSASPYASVRRAALEVLEGAGEQTPEALATIRRAANDDPEPDVRDAAAKLAKRLEAGSAGR